jgi:mannose/cellobiose epimerase-like protein (N-acyl-D-glucosamine 2-epimerase family)
VITDDSLDDKVMDFRARFVGRTLPFMIKHGWDWERGGLIERLTRGGTDDDTPFRRVMVHARQLYVFSFWAAETGDIALTEHADRIFAFMTERFWDHRHGGWIEKVDLKGRAIGFDKDLYAHAFALFGLGSYQHGLARCEAGPWVSRSTEILEQRFLRTDGSFSDRMSREFHDLAPDRRSQNPHMHLLEAALSLAETGGREAHAGLARHLLRLFSRAFLDTDNGVVLEHLDSAFAPHPINGHQVEPGHHFEWAWLLDLASRALGEAEHRELALPILERGFTVGWDRDQGGVFDEVDRRTGQVLLSTKRIWPLLELLKALAVFSERGPERGPERGGDISLAGAIDLLLERYLSEDGRWTERFNADWSPADRTMPSSTAYHISMALSELERVTEAMSPAIPPSDSAR